MYSSFFNYFIIIFIIIFVISTCCIPIIFNSKNLDFSIPSNSEDYYISSNFCWPVPGFTRITSPFGYRKAPTSRCF